MELLRLERKIAGHLDQSLYKVGAFAFVFIIATHEVAGESKDMHLSAEFSVFQAEQMSCSVCAVLQPVSALATAYFLDCSTSEVALLQEYRGIIASPDLLAKFLKVWCSRWLTFFGALLAYTQFLST